MAAANNQHQAQTCVGEKGGVWYKGQGHQEGFFFREYQRYQGNLEVTVYVYCVDKWKGNCPVKGEIIHCGFVTFTGQLKINNAGIRGPLIINENLIHNHQGDSERENLNRVNQRIMLRAANETVPLKKIYDEELNKESAVIGSRMPYRAKFEAMQKRRQRAQPRVPNTIQELVTRVRKKMPVWFRSLEGGPFLAAHKENAMLFVSPVTKLLLSQNDLLFTMDGTFKVAPLKPKIYQVYTLGAVFRKVFIPIAFGIFQDKSAATYRWMFEELKKVNWDWNPRLFMTDFETGAIAAVAQVFPEARHMGCWFHYSQAIQKQCGKLHLIHYMRENEELKKTIKKLMALPLLPPQLYIRGYEIIEEECQQFLGILGIPELLHYMRTYWIQIITPNMISVHGAPVRTNNLQEAYHGNITLHVSDSRRMVHPRFWRFLEALRTMERDGHAKFLAILAGKDVSFPKNKRWKEHHRRIEEAVAQLDASLEFAQQNVQEAEIRAALELIYIQEFLKKAKYFFKFPEVEAALPANPNVGDAVEVILVGDPNEPVQDEYWDLPPNPEGPIEVMEILEDDVEDVHLHVID